MKSLLVFIHGLVFMKSTTSVRLHYEKGPSHKTVHWSYEGIDGPDSWPKHYEHCGGMHQSPINIDTKSVTYDPNLGEFDLSRFDVHTQPTVFNITNNGHSASAAIGKEMYCRGGGLPGEFKTAEFHFHWGSDDRKGSEHGIDMKNYPLEMHIVHYNTKYGTLSKAKAEPDGLAVLGVMFEISEHDNPNFEPITSALHNIRKEGERDSITNLHIVDLLPRETNKFYRYKGSLTTPPCYESVTWTVFAVPQKISSRQLAALRSLIMGDHGDTPAKGHSTTFGHANSKTNAVKYMVDNYRPFQPIHDRIISKSFSDSIGSSAEVKSVEMMYPIEANSDKSRGSSAPSEPNSSTNIMTSSHGNSVGVPKHIISGANQFPGGLLDAINAANQDQKAAATETRVSVMEQLTDLKLGQAETPVSTRPKDNLSNVQVGLEAQLEAHPPPTTEQPLTEPPSTPPPTTTLKPTTKAITTTALPVVVQPATMKPTRIQKVLPPYESSYSPESGTTLVKSLQAPIQGSKFHVLPSWLSKMISQNTGHISVPQSHPVPANTHIKPTGSNAAIQSHHEAPTETATYGSQSHFTGHNTFQSRPTQTQQSSSYALEPQRQTSNPFLRRSSYGHSQFIPIPNRRPVPATQQPSKTWLLPQNRPSSSDTSSVYGKPMTFTSPVLIPTIPRVPQQPKPIQSYPSPYQRGPSLLESPANQRPTPINTVSRSNTPSQNSNLSIDRELLLRALKRIQAIRENSRTTTTTTTPKPPEEKPYIWLHSSRDPIRVSSKFAKGMYDRLEHQYKPIGSALRSLGISSLTEVR